MFETQAASQLNAMLRNEIRHTSAAGTAQDATEIAAACRS
jgi:hypothetical protein